MPLITKLSPSIKWVTTRWFGVLTTIAFVACIALLVLDWTRFTDAVVRAVRQHPIETLFLYYLTFIPIALLHELGHAAVANFYGGEIPEIVIGSNGNFAVITNMTVLKDKRAKIWYLIMGTVVDVFIWLALLVTFHFTDNYLVLLFVLPQTIYFLIYSYSIFKNSDFLKAVCAALNEPVPAKPWKFLRDSWTSKTKGKDKLVWIMSVSLAVKLVVTALLVVTFIFKEPRVLVLYLIYRLMVLVIGKWHIWWKRAFQTRLNLSSVEMKSGRT